MKRIFPGRSKNTTGSPPSTTATSYRPLRRRKEINSVQRRFFLRNLGNMLLCTLLPLILLGSVVSTIMIRTLEESATTSNYNMLEQTKYNIESVVNELDYMNIGFSVNSTMLSLLRRTLTHETFSSSLNQLKTTINTFLIPLTVSRPYVKSLYIYMDNPYGRFVTAHDGLVTLSTYKDTNWITSYEEYRESDITVWCEPRQFREYSFLTEDTEVITLYKKFFIGEGVYILNISRNFFEDEINKLSLYPDQSILALNEKNEVLFHNSAPIYLSNWDMEEMESDGSFIIPNYRIEGKRYYIIGQRSETYDWKYLSVIPYSSLYESLYSFITILAVSMVVTVLICIALSYYNVRRSMNSVMQIISLFEAAEKGLPLPEPPEGSQKEDLYGKIMENIVKTYVRHNTLNQQLVEKRYEAKVLELSSLQSQISPHFLFNTLKSIFWMSFQLTNSKNDVSIMIEDMVDILDYSLTDRDSLVSLAEEIGHTKSYIQIQQMRYNYQFQVRWVYPENVDEFYTVKLLLQPLVENCIIHGFTWEEYTHPKILIRIRMRPDHIEIKVVDNGSGISRDNLEKIRRRLSNESYEGHIGIYNCNRRLSLTFGSGYGLSLDSREGLGTRITVRFPYTHEDG